MTSLHAQPYDITASGFYFETPEQYAALAARAVNGYGQKVEEFEIQFIDGEEIDAALAVAWGLNQTSFAAYLKAVDEWDEEEKRRYVVAVGECGYAHADVADDPYSVDIDLYAAGTLRDLAIEFVEEGLFGDIPESLQFYIDFEAIARDLAVDYTEITIAGERLIYRCG